MRTAGYRQGIETEKHVYPTLTGMYDDQIDEYREKAPQIVNASIDEAITAGAKRVAGSCLFGKKNVYLNSSAGPKGNYKSTFYNMTVRAFQDELDASGQGLAVGCIPHNGETKILEAGKTAGYYSKLHRNGKQAQAGTYDVIMSPAVAANLIGTIPSDANPLSIMIGQSSLADKIGEKLAPDFVNVHDDGLQPDGLGSTPFDLEGTPRKKLPLFEDGVLKNYVHNTTSAKMFQAESTGNAALIDIGIGASKLMGPANSNIVFNNGDHSFDELLESSRKTIFVTCNWYTRYTSRISTEYSTIPRDAAFLVENGELSTPLKNFRISDNILRQFANIDAMGNNRVQIKWWEVVIPTWIPSLRIKDCRITTATQ